MKVYAGIDPVTKRRRYITKTVPAGSEAVRTAEKTVTKLLNQVDEKRNPRTTATLNQLLDRWLDVHHVEASTRRGYESKIDKHIRPVLGSIPVGRIDAEVLDAFYADLCRCRDHCKGRAVIQHRTRRTHQCDEHAVAPCDPPDPACQQCRRKCKPHSCQPLSDSSVRAIHWILSGAFQRAVRWDWLALNPTDQAEPPPVTHPDPRPPNTAEAAHLVAEASRRDPDWGAFVWVAMTTGARRGEICALHWSDIDLDTAVVTIRRAIHKDQDGRLGEKDTKTHQQRRIVLDPDTVEVLREHRLRWEVRAATLAIDPADDAYVFSADPDGSAPVIPDSVTQRYKRMANQLDIDTSLKNLRHYSATELITAGVDIRTIAGRLGHGSGGATTLRVYAAWTAEADQRAAATLSARMPTRDRPPDTTARTSSSPVSGLGLREHEGPYRQVAADLLGAIASGVLRPGDHLPTVKELAARYGVSIGTAHRAIALLNTDGLVRVSRGRRTTVA